MRDRYRVEWRILGAWVPTDVFSTYEAADEWARTLLTSVNGQNGVRVIDTSLEVQHRDAVVWSVER